MKDWHQREAARQTLAREVGYVQKPHVDRMRVGLAFPNTYFVGMSNLGFQTVYRLFNDHPDTVCERVFLPPKQELQTLVQQNARLVTLESQIPLGDLDVLAFSVSFEWDYTNVLTMLRLAGLPLRAADRDHRHPLVVIGGAVTFVNPEPLALFADVIAAGEGEVLVPSLLEAVARASSREDLLRQLTAERGFYIPSFYDVQYNDNGTIAAFVPRAGTGAPPVVKKAALKTTDAVDPPATSIFTPDTEFGSRFLIEVVRGCANLCRFCWAGYNYLPVRAFPTARILELARAARTHANRVGLVSIALCDHPDIEHILTELAAMGYSISPASLRLDDLTPTIVRLLRESGERTLTIAPETGSDRLRRVINKTVTNDEILEKADLIFGEGIENLKLYYMIGLPTETDEDLVAMRDLTVQLRDIMMRHAKGRGQIGRIVGSVNPLVPKPGTSYQWLPMTDTSRHRAQDEASADAGQRPRPRLLLDQERAPLLLPGADVARRPSRGAGHRGRRTERRPVAPGGAGVGRRRRLLHLPRPVGRPGAALGHHRRRDEGPLLQERVRQGPARGVDAAAQAAAGERAPAADAVVTAGRCHHGPGAESCAGGSTGCSAAWASNCA